MFDKRGSDSLRKWWWEVDILSLLMLVAVMIIGAVLITTASPAVAERIKLSPFHFVYKHFIFLGASAVLMISISTLSEVNLKRLGLFGLLLALLLMAMVLFVGDEVKGARRWISIAGFSLQPSEFTKHFLAVIVGLILAEQQSEKRFPAFLVVGILYCIVVTLLILQPDFGMTVSITIVTAGQLFIAGLGLVWIIAAAVICSFGVMIAYTTLPHVAKRINSFLSPEESENYQVSKSLEAYLNGGLFGRGPGEGAVKSSLPDSHTDFIFAVVGEEFGGIFACMIIALFFCIVMRGLSRLGHEYNLFYIYAASGIILHFAFQTIFNIGVTLHLFPTKGITLPFISYGGSSVLSFGMAMGMYLNFTKRRYGVMRPNAMRHRRI